MRKLLIITIFPMFVFSEQTSRLWEFTILVQDQSEKPIQDVNFYISYYGKVKGKWTKQRLEGKTGSDGEISFKKSALHMLRVSLEKKGYFSAGLSPELSDLVVTNNRWLPENSNFKIVMSEKNGMRPLMAKYMNLSVDKTILPDEGDHFDYDLMKGDWVKPFGKGEVPDLRFEIKTIGSPDNQDDVIGIKYTVSTVGEENGLIQVHDFDLGFVKSALKLKLGKTAPDEGYQSKLEFTRAVGTGSEISFQDKADGYWVRIRSKTDSETGEILSAYYGKIVSPIRIFSNRDEKIQVQFDYQISPDPNNRSVVWDRETTLIPGYTLPSWGARYY